MICFRAIARWKSGDVCEELTSLERKIRCKPGSEMSVALLHQSRGHSFQLISVSLDKMSRHPSVWRWPTWIDGERQVVNMISPLVAIVGGGKFARARKLRIWGARLRYTRYKHRSPYQTITSLSDLFFLFRFILFISLLVSRCINFIHDNTYVRRG